MNSIDSSMMDRISLSLQSIIKGHFVPDIVNGFDHCIKKVHYLEDPKIVTGHFKLVKIWSHFEMIA